MTKDRLKSVVPATNSLLCIVTFGFALAYGDVKALETSDAIVAVIGVVAVLFWKFGSAKQANLMLQVGTTVGFVSTFRSVWAHPHSELPLSWYLWAVSFFLQAVVVRLRWKGRASELVYPLNCLWLHVVVALIATFK